MSFSFSWYTNYGFGAGFASQQTEIIRPAVTEPLSPFVIYFLLLDEQHRQRYSFSSNFLISY
jgi:hypothetical protein